LIFLLLKKYYLLVTYLPGYDCKYGCIKICFSKKINSFSLQLAGNEIKLVEAAILLGGFPFLVLSFSAPFSPTPRETWPGDQPAAEKRQKQRKYNKLNSLPHCFQQQKKRKEAKTT